MDDCPRSYPSSLAECLTECKVYAGADDYKQEECEENCYLRYCCDSYCEDGEWE